MATREAFLGRVRKAMASAAPLFEAGVSPKPADPEAEARALRAQALSCWPALLERFRIEFEEVAGVFHRVSDLTRAVDRVIELTRTWEAREIVTWASETLPIDVAALRERGLGVDVASPMTVKPEQRPMFRELVAKAQVGVTGVDFAVAETGSLVLLSGAGQGRGVSLLPTYHVAVLGKQALVPSLADLGVHLEALHRAPDRSLTGSAVQIITGPSRTADIEQTLSRGVHGPKEVHAIFVDAL